MQKILVVVEALCTLFPADFAGETVAFLPDAEGEFHLCGNALCRGIKTAHLVADAAAGDAVEGVGHCVKDGAFSCACFAVYEEQSALGQLFKIHRLLLDVGFKRLEFQKYGNHCKSPPSGIALRNHSICFSDGSVSHFSL